MINISNLSIERPIGSDSNNEIIRLLKNEMEKYHYELISLPIQCNFWSKRKSYMIQDGIQYEILPSPFSMRFKGKGRIIVCSNISDLEKNEIENTILLLRDEITKEPIMPKGFPFYFPDEHKKLYEKIEESNLLCVLTITGKHPMSGLDPFPFFEDGNFKIPSGYMSNRLNLKDIDYSKEVEMIIDSNIEERKTEQIVFYKEGRNEETIVICAHMDSKYGTEGAIDNASGIYTLMKIAHELEKIETNANIEIVPFNGEEYYGVSGQLKYLEYIEKRNKKIKLVVNIDSPGYKGSKNALSFYNIDEGKISAIMQNIKEYDVGKGVDWYAGDHAMFVFQGIPCIVATSSNLFETAINVTHTEKDVPSNVDTGLLRQLATLLVQIVTNLDKN